MKRYIFIIACLLSIFTSISAFAAKVTKVVITIPEPVVGEKRSFKASVPKSASTEITNVSWKGKFDNGKFIQGNDYTISIRVLIKDNAHKIFSTSCRINATINGKRGIVTNACQNAITVRYTWKTLGGERPKEINVPQENLKTKLKEIAAAYNATNADNYDSLIKYLKSRLPEAEIWSTGVSYRYTRKMPSATTDGHINVPIGITCDGVTLKNYNFSVTLPALNKSPEATHLSADVELMKTALKNLIVNAQTTGDDLLAAVNAAAVHGTKAEWDKNYRYTAPQSDMQGSIDGNLIFTLGNSKDIYHAHKTLPIAGTAADAKIDADFSALSKALHNYAVNNSTTQQKLIDIANSAITNGSLLTFVGYSKTEATYESEGKIVIRFELALDGKHRSPRISMRMPKLRPPLPADIAVTHDEWEVLRLTNIERFKAGRPALAIVAPLQDATDIRAEEIKTDYRADHLRPNGSSCFTVIDSDFRKYRKLGENIARAQVKPSQVMNSWMNSLGHKANILTSDFCYFGIGVSGPHNHKYWVQMFSDGSGIISADTSTGSLHFPTVADMGKAHLICTTGEGLKAYVPLDADCMTKNGNQYTLHFHHTTVTITIDAE